LYQAGKDGFFEADGERWGSVSAIAKDLGLETYLVVHRLKTCRNRKGKQKDQKGRVFNFYALSDVRKACVDLLDPKLYQAGKDGFFEADGERWGTHLALSTALNLNRKTIKRVTLKHLEIRKLRGKSRLGALTDRDGNPFTFYALSEVRAACADLLKKKKSSVKK
jgi:hypothetical protein